MARGAKIDFTKEQRIDMAECYRGGMTLKDIQARHGLATPHPVRRVLKEEGIDIAVGGRPLPKGKKCKCGHIAPVGSKFCNMCGEQLLSEDEKIIEGLLKARNNSIRYIPAHLQSEADEAMLKAINLLKIKCGVV